MAHLHKGAILKFILFLIFFCVTQSVFAQAKSQSSNEKVILFLGDSLTAGYGLEQKDSFPYKVGELFNANGVKVKIINGGVSGSTTASGPSRLRWFLRSKPSLIFLALGANDGLRGINLDSSKENLSKVIKKAKQLKIPVVLAGMQIPTNYGEEYRNKFKQMFISLSKEYQIPIMPFLLEGVAGVQELNLEDGIHPNAKGYDIIAKNVYKVLKDLL